MSSLWNYLIFETSLSSIMIIFTHIPKTAGTTLKSILRNNFGIYHVDSIKVKKPVYTADDLRFAKRVFFKVKAITGHNLVNPPANLQVEGAQLITMLRDPVTRCASHYQDLTQRGNLKLSFEEWIKQEKNQNAMVKIISGSNDLQSAKELLKHHYHFVGISERFQDSLKLLNIILNEPLDLQYRSLIKARSNETKKRLMEDEASLNLLKKHNQLDQQLYEFAMEDIFLPMVEKYSQEMKSMIIPAEKKGRRKTFRISSSIRYNKFVYRQLIKLFRR